MKFVAQNNHRNTNLLCQVSCSAALRLRTLSDSAVANMSDMQGIMGKKETNVDIIVTAENYSHQELESRSVLTRQRDRLPKLCSALLVNSLLGCLFSSVNPKQRERRVKVLRGDDGVVRSSTAASLVGSCGQKDLPADIEVTFSDSLVSPHLSLPARGRNVPQR